MKSRQPIVPVSDWLVLGSFPMTERSEGKWLENGYECEADFAPSDGETFDGRKWTVYRGERINFMDLVLPFAERSWCYAYALTYLHATRQQKVRLLIGSDDGVAVWLNGQPVHRVDCQRGLVVDQDEITVTLREGWNVLLCKVAQGQGGWDLSVRLGGTARAKAPDVRFALKRPSAKRFPGLRGRRNGLVLHDGAPMVSVTTGDAGIAVTLGLRVFNDSAEKATRVKTFLVDTRGMRYSEESLPPFEPFEGRVVTARLIGEGALAALSGVDGLQLAVSSSFGDIARALPPDTAARLFLMAMTGFDIPADPDATIAIPPMFRGRPGFIEIVSGLEHRLSREVSWPEAPQRMVLTSETESGSVQVKIRPPIGMPEPQGRLLFGDRAQLDLIRRVRFVVHELGADLSLASAEAQRGLAAMAKGSFSEAMAALQDVYDRLARSLPDRSDQQIVLTGHAHIDMNWLWVSSETAQCCHDTFRQVLAFMEEFPEFTFSQSQASTYLYIEQSDPEMFARIRQRVAEGRWELLGGCLTEGDTNLSSGEGIVRQLLIGQRYFHSRFGKIACVGWLPDNFGHVAQLPQILRLAGIEFFYAHRCQPKLGPYIWEGVDGSQVINFATPTYNGEIDPQLRLVPETYDPINKKLLWVYGVGDHGGGPSRRDITRALAYRNMPSFPAIAFGTAEEFFRALEAKAYQDLPAVDENQVAEAAEESTEENGETTVPDLPVPAQPAFAVHKGELQYVFEGCYTSIARIKEANRRCENTLYAAEMLAAFASLYGQRYPTEILGEAWHSVVYNQFHDILCGSAIWESNRESIGVYDAALAKAEQVRYGALRTLAARVPTRHTSGQPLVVYNPLGRARTDIVEAEVFSYLPPPTARLRHWGSFYYAPFEVVDVGQGPYATVRLVDQSGEAVDAQIVDGKLFPNGYRLKVQFLARDVPPCGVRTFYCTPGEPGARPASVPVIRGTTIETPFLRVVIDPETGHIRQIRDRRREKDLLLRNQPGNVLKVYMEAPHGMSAWELGPVTAIHTLDDAESVRVIESGPVRAVVETRRRWSRSTFTQRTIVYRDLPRIDFELDVRWFELGGPNVDSPTLRVAFPLAVRNGRFVCDTPFAAVERPTTGREVPAQKWIDLSGLQGGAALLNDSKYGHRCDGTTLETTLLRASYDPDLYPDQGPHLIRYSLLPHEGDWIFGNVHEEALAFNTRLLAIETPPDESGDLPSGSSLLSVEPENVYLSAVKRAEDSDALIVRLYEAHGAPAQAVLRLHRPAQRVTRVDLLEREHRGVPPAFGVMTEVRIPLREHEIATLRVEF